MNRRHTEAMEARARELYEQHPFGDFCYGFERERHNAPLCGFLRAISAQGLVLDIGCGAGYWCEAAVRAGVVQERIVPVDMVRTGLAPLRDKGFRTVCGDVLSLPLADSTADFTICNGVIHHTPNPRDAFRELVRVTKPGGRIFLAVYNRWNPYFGIVHRAAAPIRYAYWRWDRRVLNWIYPVAQVAFQPLAYLIVGRSLDRRSGLTLLADQMMTPYAHLFSKRQIHRYASACGCEILRFGSSGGRMMLTAIIRVGKPVPAR